MKVQSNSLRRGNALENHKTGILFVSSYPPRACGIASYCMDLFTAFKNAFGESFYLKVCALENKLEERAYPPEVLYSLHVRDHSAVLALAAKVNRNPALDAVFIQYEFGLFGGNRGDDVLLLLAALQKPAWITFHTVLPDPDSHLRRLVRQIAENSAGVVVMTQSSAELLVQDYALPRNLITIIPHGTHLVEYPDRAAAKRQLGLEGRHVLTTFGLLNPGKSIETAIEALPEIIRHFPETVYLVLGCTHPEIVLREGEAYREFLEQRVSALGLGGHVRFVNSYLSREHLLEFLKATDIYLFVSHDPHQAVSGTFAYAMSCSCPMISTPIPHAKEMLEGGSGMIVDFKSSPQVAQAVIELLGNPARRRQMNLNALHRIRPTVWENAALAHLELFKKTLPLTGQLRYTLPKVSLAHLRKLTTSQGIIQFAEINQPQPASGSTLDDNARALIAVTWHSALFHSKKSPSLAHVYLHFMESMQLDDGSFVNYRDETGGFHPMNRSVDLEDSNGRAIWALGVFLSHASHFHVSLRRRAQAVLDKALPLLARLSFPRAIAFAIKGLHALHHSRGSLEVKAYLNHLSHKLMACYVQSSDKDWPWFESQMTYANAVLPEAMLHAWLASHDVTFKQVAKRSFDFLLSHVFNGEVLRVISNQGWMQKDSRPHPYGEQPIDVTSTILALDLFYQVWGEERYHVQMEQAFHWFLGKNHLHQIMYNPVTGGCYDGLEEDHVNLNQGAESTVCYLMARLAMEKHLRNRPAEKKKELLVPVPSRHSTTLWAQPWNHGMSQQKGV